MKDLNVDDIVKFTGKSLQNITNGSEYTITRKWKESSYYIVAYLDDSKNEKYIILTNNEWRKKFIIVHSARKRKLEKLRYGSDM
jgi:hypothetical protein